MNDHLAQQFADALAVLKQDNPPAYEKLSAYDQVRWASLIALTAENMLGTPEGSTEPTFKPHPFGPCYILADLNFAQIVAVCNLITDPILQADCHSKATKAYCSALAECGDPK